MYQNYLITGATRPRKRRGSAAAGTRLPCSALVKDRDPLIYTLPNHVAVFYGDLTDKGLYVTFFAAGRR